MDDLTLRAVIYFDRGWWVAQCLEVDICTASRVRERLPKKISRQLRGQAVLDLSKGKRPFETFPKAPERFWRMYSEARPLTSEESASSWLLRLIAAFSRAPKLRTELALAAVQS